tara:strand:- start:362 stop:490 length:129 start_codon:yes stop_codon:yes gene_type:complete
MLIIGSILLGAFIFWSIIFDDFDDEDDDGPDKGIMIPVPNGI